MNNKQKDNTNLILGSGITLGALTDAEFALLGAVCPACVIGAPFLVGVGIAKKVQDKKISQRNSSQKSIANSKIS